MPRTAHTASPAIAPVSRGWPVAGHRYEQLDVLRAVAMLWMTVFHFCFDLNHFGFIRQNFYDDPVWTWQRTGIVSLFLFTAGLSQAVAVQQGQDWPRFWKRWTQVAGCAVLVSAGSWLMYPQSWIYFGVLHGLAVMLLLTRWLALQSLSTVRWLALAGLALVVHLLVQDWGALGHWPAAFNSKPLSWLGLNWRKPVTEDFVPLLPWLCIIWMGFAAGQWVQSPRTSTTGEMQPASGAPRGLVGSTARWSRPLAWLGRHSLSYYLLHQPVLIGLFMLVSARSATN